MSRNVQAAGVRAVEVDGYGRSVAIVCSRFNDLIVERLVDGARRELLDRGVADDAIDVHWVPGALEVPQVASAVAASGRFDAIVALGAVVRGDTYHFEVVSDASAAGLMRLSLDSDVVVTNGILTVDDEAQALVRSGDDDGNKGAQAALAALDGSCETPIAGLAELDGGTLRLRGEILRTDGTEAATVLHFLEAIRQLGNEVGPENALFIVTEAGPPTFALDQSLCSGVACIRFENVCPEKVFELNLFFIITGSNDLTM